MLTRGLIPAGVSIFQLLSVGYSSGSQGGSSVQSDLISGPTPSSNPRHQLRCLGDLPDFPLLKVRGDLLVDPRTLSLQEICSKPTYGGRYGANIGGYCANTIIAMDTVPQEAFEKIYRVVFDPVNTEGSSIALSNPRLMYYCMSRCFCEYATTASYPQDRRVSSPDNRDLELRAHSVESYDYELRLEENMDYTGRYPEQTLPMPETVLAVYIPAHWVETESKNPNYVGYRAKIALHPDHMLKCTGSVPDWPLPDPFSKRNFRDAQQLCAATLTGGLPSANAGGVCLKIGATRMPYFLDELTPALPFTSQNYPNALAVRAYCWTICACEPRNEGEHTESGSSRPIPWLNNAVVEGSASSEISIWVGGSVWHRQSCSSSGGGDGRKSTCQAWPEDLLGPLPRNPYTQATVSISQQSGLRKWVASHMKPECGATCEKHSDCSGSTYVDGCRCAAPRTGKPADGMWSAFFCVVITATQHSRPMKGLGGRAIQSWACPCNATYVSEGCCDALDGLVWEEPGRQSQETTL